MLAREPVRPLLGWLAFGAAMCLLPLFASTGTVRTLIFAHFLAMFAMSWDIISGRTGYISFGHPFLIGLAAYTTGMLTYHLDTPLWLSIPGAVLVTMAGGALFFLPALHERREELPRNEVVHVRRAERRVSAHFPHTQQNIRHIRHNWFIFRFHY